MKFIMKPVKGRVVVCVGTRPSFIKMAPVILKLEERGVDYRILHTGQHYSPGLADVYKELPIRDPDYHIPGLDRCETHGKQTALIMERVERIFLKEKPQIVMVCADANFNFACGVAARKLRILLGHVESGLRSGDWRTPEEHNRRMLDHISDFLFAPTFQSCLNLARELCNGFIIPTGNTVVDSMNMVWHQVVKEKPPLEGKYILMTAHREENVDDLRILSKLIESARRVKNTLKIPIIFPAHPRTLNRLERARWTPKISNQVKLVEPMPYIKFLATLSHASLVLTDSGGVQEEACTLQVPCVVLREKTDRPESVAVGAAMVAGTQPRKVVKAVREMISRPREWPNPYDPFGDQNAAERIVNSIMPLFYKKEG